MPIAQNDLRRYMLQTTAAMQSEYERIRGRSREDAGTAGDNGEENWKELLSGWLPPAFPIVTKGRIMNAKGECSDQVDLLILSPSYPKNLLGKKEYLEGGVVAAFECRLTLRPGDIKEVFEHAKQIHGMCHARTGTPYQEANGRIVFGLLAHSHDWKKPQSQPIENVREHIRAAEQIAEKPREFPDILAIADLGTWAATKMMFPPWSLRPELADAHRARYGAFDYTAGVIEAGYIEYSSATQHVPADQGAVTPIGALVVQLLERLAWDEPSLRYLAEYFVLANVTGSGRGHMRIWRMDSCLSPQTLTTVLRGQMPMPSHSRWNEWGIKL